jgi:LacI family transcriptional regulator
MNIYDIAKKSGYSSATVARALSQKGYCSARAREAIYKVAEEYGYSPNSLAKALRNNKTDRILFCIPDICNPFYFRIIEGVNKVLEKHNYYLMLYPTEGLLQREIMALELARQKYCDGIIFISFDFNEKNIKQVRAIKHPVVLGNRYLNQKDGDNFDYVFVDHISGMKTATEHLIQQRCRHVVLVSGNPKLQTSKERTEGYRQALEEAGLPIDERYIIDGKYATDAAYESFATFMKNGLPVDGVVAVNDLSAYGILQYCRDHDIRIPGDLKLVSFDNTDYAKASTPALTSIDMCQYELGQALATTLLERLLDKRKKIKNTIISPTLIVRKSST